MSRESDYVTNVRAANRQLWDAINELVSLQRQWAALDYGNTLDDHLEGTEPTDANHGLTAGQVGAVVFDTANAMVGVLNAGHATNMANLL